MRIRWTAWAAWLGLPALLLLLAACAPSQPAPAASTTPLPANTGVPTAEATLASSATALPATSTSAPSAASSAAAATLVPTAAPATLAPAGPTPTATTDPAVAVVLAYLDARARTDAATATSLSCKTWKTKALTEVTSFRSMNAKLVGVTCQVNGSAGGFTLVGCGGKMVTSYGGETKDWDLTPFVYQVSLEDGLWKMCGYH
jgi:hypothetical protein